MPSISPPSITFAPDILPMVGIGLVAGELRQAGA